MRRPCPSGPRRRGRDAVEARRRRGRGPVEARRNRTGGVLPRPRCPRSRRPPGRLSPPAPGSVGSPDRHVARSSLPPIRCFTRRVPLSCPTLPRWAVEDCTRRPRMEHPRGLAGAPASEDWPRTGFRFVARRASTGTSPRAGATVARASSRVPRPRPAQASRSKEARTRHSSRSSSDSRPEADPRSRASALRSRANPIALRALARGVKVAQVVLVHLVLVRIQAGQLRGGSPPNDRSHAVSGRNAP
ncbi:MAG: hypothetical protein RI967_2003 [Planctomycetota bacterium]